MSRKLIPSDKERIDWVKSYKSGERWFLKMRARHGNKQGTQRVYSIALKRFSEYLKMNPDEIITQYKKDLDKSVHEAVHEWNDKLETFVVWVLDNYDLGRTRGTAHHTAIKSFFKYNVSIPLSSPTPDFRNKTIQPITLEELTDKILPYADIHEKFILTFLKDSGMSQSDALRLNVGDVEVFENGFGYIKTFREKEGIDYETFIGPNATETMRQYLDFRKKQGFEVEEDSPLFVNKKKMNKRLTWRNISAILIRLGEKTGTKLSTHRLRKFFETYLAIAKVHPIILKYWVGHKVRSGKSDVESHYIIPPKNEQLKLYMEAYQKIDVNPKPDPNELFLAETRMRMANLPPDQRAKFVKEITTGFRSKAHIILNDNRIKELLEEIDITKGGLSYDLAPKFDEVDESKLLPYLRAGWTIAHNLQNGRVIVRRASKINFK